MNQSMDQQDLHLRDYLRIISKRRNLVVAVFLVVVVVAVLKTVATTPLYQATTRVLIEKAINAKFIDQGAAYRSWDPYFLETQMEVIKSKAVALRVVEKLRLEDIYYNYFPKQKPKEGLLERLGTLFSDNDSESGVKAKSVAAMTPEEKVGWLNGIAGQIRGGLSVAPINDTNVFRINFVSTNPEFAALIANAVSNAYIEKMLEMKLNSTRVALAWMTEKAEEEAAKLESAEGKLQAYMEKNQIVTIENRLAVTPQELSQISTQLITAESKRKENEARYRQVSRIAGQPDAAESVPAIAANPGLQTLRAEIFKAEQAIRELSNKFGRKHPTMIKANNDLQALQKKRRQEIARLIEGIRNDYELSRANEKSLSEQLQRVKTEALQLNQKFIQFGALRREVETNQQLYDSLMIKIKEQSLTQETQPVNLWVVEDATTPRSPISPRKARNLMLGIVLGLMLGIGLAFFLDYLDHSIKDPLEVERRLGTAVLGVTTRWEEQDPPVELVMSKAAQTPLAESFRALRTSLLLSSSEGAPASLLITSSVAGAGKTTTATNLAKALTQAGKRVLLMDGDLRKPRLHKVFRKSNRNGLSTYLAGGSGESLLQKTDDDKLVLITSGPIPPNPAELLSSQRFDRLLETLRKDFDIIICDSPPLLSCADSQILSSKFTSTLLLVRARLTTYEEAARAIKMLRDIKAPLLGLVINAMEIRKGDSYYQYYSYGSYGVYGQENDEA